MRITVEILCKVINFFGAYSMYRSRYSVVVFVRYKVSRH